MNAHVRRLLSAFALVAVATIAPAGASTGSDGASGVESGVWWQLKGGGLSVPPLADIPEGGLWLASTPSGDNARSAVRYPVPDGHVAESVTLQVHQDRSTPGIAAALCAPLEPWEPPEERPGPWAERAQPDCESFAAIGILAQDGTIEFSLTGFGPGEDVDLVLTRVPEDPSASVNATFAAPTPSDVRTSAPVSGGGFVPPAPAPDSAPAAPVADGAPSGSFGTGDTGGGSGFNAPSGGSSDIGAGSPFTPELPSTDDAVAAQVPAASGAGPSDEIAAETVAFESAWDAARWAGLVGLIVCGAWIAAIASRRLQGGAEGPSFTLYRGAPPA